MSVVEFIPHLYVQSLFKVGFPLWVVGVGLCSDFAVTADGNPGGPDEVDGDRFAVVVCTVTKEAPSVLRRRAKVFLHNPFSGFVAMSPFGPTPEGVEDVRVYPTEHLLADYVAVIIGPAPDDGVELVNQVAGCGLFVGVDDCLRFGQERFDALAGRFDEELAVVLAYVLSQEVESVVDVGYPGLFWGQFQASFLQKLFQEGEDLLCQDLAAIAGDDEIIGKPGQVDFEAYSVCTFLGQVLFQGFSIPSNVRLAMTGEIGLPWGAPALVG